MIKKIKITFLLFCLVLGFFVILNTINVIPNLFKDLSPAPASATVLNKAGGTTLKDGLVGWWTLDSVSGNKIADGSGRNNIGTNYGVTTAKGLINGAGRFNGTGSYIEANSIPLSRFSVGAWVNPSGIQTISASVVADRYATTVNYAIAFNENTTNVFAGIYNGGWYQTSAVTLPLNSWTHVMTTYDGANIKLFINGIFATSTAYSGPATSDNNGLRIGRRWDNPNIFNGLIDDVRIYNRPLSDSEIKQLYQLGGTKINKTPTVTLQTGLLGWWTMDGKDFIDLTHIKDKSGNNNNGTISGGVTKANGKIGQGLKFDGSTGYVDVGTSTYSEVYSNFTMSAWVKPYANPTANGFALSKDFSSGGRGFGMGLNTSRAIYLEANGQVVLSGAGTVIPLNTWSLISVVHNGSNWVVYQNGNFVVSSSLQIGVAPNNTAKWYINGRQYTGVFSPIPVIEDDVRIYNRALTPTEIAELYTQGGGKINKTDLIRAQLRTGLVGHWTFDGKDWATSLITLDKSGNGNNGTLNGGVTKVAGKIGQGLKFSAGYVDIPNIALTNFTVSGWIKKTGSTGTIQTPITMEDVIDKYFRIDINNNSLYLYNYDGGSFNGAIGATTILDNTWYFVTATRNGDDNTFYVNGVQKGTHNNTLANILSTNGFLGARNQASDAYLFNGSLDDVRIYNRALSAQEIYELYRMGK